MKWFNREYLLKKTDSEFITYIEKTFEDALDARGIQASTGLLARLVPIIRERISTTNELRVMIEEGEFDFFFVDPTPLATSIPGKDSSSTEAQRHLQAVCELLSSATNDVFNTSETLKDLLWPYATEHGRGNVLWPLRFTLTGRERSPDPFIVMSMIGKDASIRRIEAARVALTL